ncbi:MAG: hypothetical protein ACRDJN_23395, partial [Chloroflexota bacterium]
MATQLRAAAARTVITPPLGVSLAGSYSDRRATSVHHDLYARAFVLEGEGTLLAVVSCDLIGVRASTVAGARRLIEQTCGLPPAHVLIAATHNHSGPLARELGASGPAGENDEPYLAMLERQIAGAVQQAIAQLAPARLRLTLGEAAGIAFNRRFVMDDGPVRTNPGKANPHLREPAAPVDTRVWTLTALPPLGQRPGGSPTVPPEEAMLAMLVNFGLHPAIVGGVAIGGDFPTFLETGVQRLLGPGGNRAENVRTVAGSAAPAPVVVFANAPCGDINHIDVSHPQPQSGIVEAARVGTILAAEAGKAACRIVPDWETGDTGPPLRAGRQLVELRLRRPSADEVEWARQIIASGLRMTMEPGGGLRVVEAHRIAALADLWTGPTHRTEVQALAVGDDLAIVGLPGEVFVELGLDLRRRSPFAHTLVLGLANEAIGYVPTRRAYDEGGYEPTSSRLQPGSGEQLVDEALAVLK